MHLLYLTSEKNQPYISQEKVKQRQKQFVRKSKKKSQTIPTKLKKKTKIVSEKSKKFCGAR